MADCKQCKNYHCWEDEFPDGHIELDYLCDLGLWGEGDEYPHECEGFTPQEEDI